MRVKHLRRERYERGLYFLARARLCRILTAVARPPLSLLMIGLTLSISDLASYAAPKPLPSRPVSRQSNPAVGQNGRIGPRLDRAPEIGVDMKSAVILLFLLAVHTNWASAQTRQAVGASIVATSAEDEIKKLEEARNQAILHGDAAALDRMTSDDYTFITLRGEMRSKSDILKGFASGSFHYESREISDLKVRTYGDTAVVTGRSVQKGVENGKDYSGDYWFTRVYVKQKGRWLTVALQTTLIQQ